MPFNTHRGFKRTWVSEFRSDSNHDSLPCLQAAWRTCQRMRCGRIRVRQRKQRNVEVGVDSYSLPSVVCKDAMEESGGSWRCKETGRDTQHCLRIGAPRERYARLPLREVIRNTLGDGKNRISQLRL